MSNQPESPTNARHPITPSPTSLVSLFDQNPGDDTAYIVPSPSTSEGNQMGYYRKYGHSPLGENSRAAVKARLLEFEVWSAQNPEFQQRTEIISYTERGTQTAIDDATKTLNKRQRSKSDYEDFPTPPTRKMKMSPREAVTLLRDAVGQLREATMTLQHAIESFEEEYQDAEEDERGVSSRYQRSNIGRI